MGSRSVKQGESPNLLREKENEISMKIDEAGKGASFHQQVRQTKLGDKSRGGRSLGPGAGLAAFPSVGCLGRPAG